MKNGVVGGGGWSITVTSPWRITAATGLVLGA
jgi:hypothetical protein